MHRVADKKKTRAKRSRQRGAAFVEAALVLPFLVGFFGMMIWFHDLHKKKQDVMLETRRAALTDASHARCAEPPPENPDLGGEPEADQVKSFGAKLAGAALSLVFSPVDRERTQVARGKYKTTGDWTHDVKHKSKVMCNERTHPEGLMGMLSFGKDIASRMIDHF